MRSGHSSGGADLTLLVLPRIISDREWFFAISAPDDMHGHIRSAVSMQDVALNCFPVNL
jgi:hypothetical protein